MAETQGIKTGQATGLLLTNWVRCIGGKYIQNQSCEGIKKSVQRLMESNPNILRVVINIGPAVKKFPAVCMNYSGQKSKEAYLAKWIAFDFLVLSKNWTPTILTIIQTVTDDGKVIQKAFINKECVREGNPADPDSTFWNDMKNAASRMGFEELWGTLTGATIPYRGFLQKRTKGILYTSEEDRHVCILSESGMDKIPEAQDQVDIERLENMLEYSGLAVEDYIKDNMSEKVVAQMLKQIAGVQTNASKETAEQSEEIFSGAGKKPSVVTGLKL